MIQFVLIVPPIFHLPPFESVGIGPNPMIATIALRRLGFQIGECKDEKGYCLFGSLRVGVGWFFFKFTQGSSVSSRECGVWIGFPSSSDSRHYECTEDRRHGPGLR